MHAMKTFIHCGASGPVEACTALLTGCGRHPGAHALKIRADWGGTDDPGGRYDERKLCSIGVGLERRVEGARSVAVQVGRVGDEDDEGAHHLFLHHRPCLRQHLRQPPTAICLQPSCSAYRVLTRRFESNAHTMIEMLAAIMAGR